MMPRLCLALGLVAASRAAAGAECKRVGPSALEVARKTNGVVTETITLWASGAWTFAQPAVPADGAAPALPAVRATGCLDGKALDLGAIDWTVTHPRIRCHAKSASSTDYAVAGRHRFTQTLCGPEQLDAESTARLASVVAQLDAATASARRPVPPPQRSRPTPALPADPQQPPTDVQP